MDRLRDVSYILPDFSPNKWFSEQFYRNFGWVENLTTSSSFRQVILIFQINEQKNTRGNNKKKLSSYISYVIFTNRQKLSKSKKSFTSSLKLRIFRKWWTNKNILLSFRDEQSTNCRTNTIMIRVCVPNYWVLQCDD